jgi:hypothetical protein
MFETYEDLIKYLGSETFKEGHHFFESFSKDRNEITSMTKKDLKTLKTKLSFTDQQYDEILIFHEFIYKNEQMIDALKFLKYVLIIKAHPSDWIIKNPPVIKNEQISSTFFQLYTLLNVVIDSINNVKMRKIPEKYIAFNLNHFKNYIQNYYHKHQRLGIEPFGWCTYLATIGLIELNALNFMHHKYHDPYLVYRHKVNKHIVIIAKENLKVRADGQIDGTNQIYKQSFMTTLEQNHEFHIGYRINPLGFIENKKIRIPLDQYECILKEGDDVIDFHIPTRKGYEVFDIKQSMQEAKLFFETHYSEYRYKAFWCISWLYSPQLLYFIHKPTSNILKIAKQGYRCPATPGETSLYSFVFKTEHPDLKSIQPNTSLEKGVIDYVLKGGTINNGLYLFMIDDLNLFGHEPYINHKDYEILTTGGQL